MYWQSHDIQHILYFVVLLYGGIPFEEEDGAVKTILLREKGDAVIGGDYVVTQSLS